MAPETRCSACGGELAAGSQFCGLCGARQPPSCANCGAALPEGAAFCGACGATVGAAPPATPTPAVPAAAANCSQCGEPLREGARFCRKCGTPSVPGAVPPTSVGVARQASGASAPQAVSAQAIVDQLTWSSAAAGLGFIIALVSAFLAWAKASAGGASVSVAPLDGDALFRLGDVIGSDPSKVDGFAALILAIAGLAILIASLMGRLPEATGKSLLTGAGAALAALAFMEMQYVNSRPEPQGVSISFGFGLYLLVIGGALAFASSWIPAKRLKG